MTAEFSKYCHIYFIRGIDTFGALEGMCSVPLLLKFFIFYKLFLRGID